MRLIDADALLKMIENSIEESGKHRMAVLAEEVIDIINDYAEDYEAEEDYQRGLNAAWEATRKIVGSISLGGLNTHELMELFGTSLATEIVYMVTADQAIEKLRAYEAKKKAEEEIEVGDEVETTAFNKVIVLKHLHDGYYAALNDKFEKVMIHSSGIAKKTGRHFPQAAELLDAMKEDGET